MGMFTDLFKKSHDPYDLGGRWYKMRLKNDESASIIISDIPELPIEEMPDSFGYILQEEGDYIGVNIAFGILVDFVIVPVSGNITYSDIESAFYSDPFVASYVGFNKAQLSGGTVDLYLYIVRK